MKLVFIDIETYSDLKLMDVGLDAYSRDCELLTVCYGGMRTEVRNDNPRELERLARDPRVVFIAHNAAFERTILARAINVSHSFRDAFAAVPIERWRCTQAKAASVGLPLSLAGATAALGVPQDFEKDADGKRLIKKFCLPRKPTKKDPTVRFDPFDDPEDFDRLIEYCKQDVVACRWLWQNTPHTNYPDNQRELELWFLDQRINDRGFSIDSEGVERMIEVLDGRMAELGEEVSKLTNGEVTTLGQRDRILQFCKEHNVTLKDLSAFTVEQALKHRKIQKGAKLEPVKRILGLRQQGSKSSIAKYQKMQKAVEGRMRYSLQYCGAGRTGRWAGRNVQPQNFPRPTLKSDEVLFATEALIDGDWDLYYERRDLMDHGANALRSMIKAPDGKLLCAADLAGIENRMLMWLADDQETLDKIRSGVDLYVELAADEIFKKPAEEITDDERFSGKTGMLACIAGNAEVLTRNGWIKLDTLHDQQVWDGEEFVSHQGLIYRGVKHTIRLNGVQLTPDHEVLTYDGWEQSYRLNKSNFRLVDSAVPSCFQSKWGVLASALYLWGRTRTSVTKITKRKNEVLWVPVGRKHIESEADSWDDVHQTVFDMEPDDTEMPQPKRQELHKIRRSWHQSMQALATQFRKLLGRYGRVLRTRVNSRSYKQFQRVLQTELPMGYATRAREKQTEQSHDKYTERHYDISRGFRMLRDTVWNFMEQGVKRVGYLQSSNSTAEVYDIYQCGPRNRFVVRATKYHTPIILKNCGYQGWTDAVCLMAKGYGVILPQEEGTRIASAWRRKFPKPVALWKAYETAWRTALNDRSPVEAGKCLFQTQDRYMTITLPSGRVLYYMDPDIDGDGKLRYMHNFQGSLTRTGTYGGKICENICQACSRDVLAWNMPDLEKAGYRIVLTVHDEVISEIDRYSDLEHEHMAEIMTRVPPWAEGLPLAAEGYTAKRYRK